MRTARSFFLIGLVMASACTQTVHLKSAKRITKAVIDGETVENIGPEGRDVILPVKFGAAHYELYDRDLLIGKGRVERSQINPWSYGLSVGGAMVLTPALALTGVLAVNPAWVFSSSVFLQGGGVGAFWAYLTQTASAWTFPAATLGAAIGLLPLLGLLYSEKLPDVVMLSTDGGLKLSW